MRIFASVFGLKRAVRVNAGVENDAPAPSCIDDVEEKRAKEKCNRAGCEAGVGLKRETSSHTRRSHYLRSATLTLELVLATLPTAPRTKNNKGFLRIPSDSYD